MEIIVNCSEFAKAIQKAFDVEAHCIQYFAGQGTIVFGTKRYQSDIEFGCEKRYPKENETISFNHLKMAKLLFFLRTIPVQPINIIIHADTVRAEKVIIEF